MHEAYVHLTRDILFNALTGAGNFNVTFSYSVKSLFGKKRENQPAEVVFTFKNA